MKIYGERKEIKVQNRIYIQIDPPYDDRFGYNPEKWTIMKAWNEENSHVGDFFFCNREDAIALAKSILKETGNEEIIDLLNKHSIEYIKKALSLKRTEDFEPMRHFRD